MADPLVVIGVGNRDRGDDGVGPLVCDLVAHLAPDRVRCTIVEGSTIDLPVRWAPDDDVVIVDAAAPDGTPGAVTIDDPEFARLVPPAAWSTHGIDVGAAVELARALGRLPARLRIVGIEGARFDHGAAITPVVVRSAGAVANLIATWAASGSHLVSTAAESGTTGAPRSRSAGRQRPTTQPVAEATGD